MYCSVASITPSQGSVSVYCNSYDFDEKKTSAALYRLTLAQYLDPDGVERSDDPGRPIVSGVRFAQGVTHRNVRMASIPAQPIGLYLIRVTTGDGSRYDLFTSVSSIGLMTVGAGASHSFVPVSLGDYRFVRDGITMTAIAPGGSTALPQLADGTFSAPPDSNVKIYASARDGSIAFASSWWWNSADRNKRWFLQTDRPIYRPGDIVHVRVIERSGYIGDFTVDRAPQTVVLQELYPTVAIARRTIAPDEYGTLSMDARLPQDAALGEYQVIVGGTSVGYVSVQAYKKPEYSIAASGPAHPLLGGTDGVFHVHLAYFSGTPAGGFTVHAYGGLRYWRPLWYGPFDMIEPWNPGPAFSVDQTATTDAGGNATFRVPTTHDENPGYLGLTFDARDESGRTVTTQSTAEIVPADFPVVMTPDTWLAWPRRETTIKVSTIGYDRVPRPGVHVHVRIVEDDSKNGGIDRGALTVTTDSRGVGQFGFTPPEPGSYRYEAQAVDVHGNAVTATQYQWAPDPDAGWAPPIQEPQLIVAKSLFAPHEMVHVLLALTKPDGDALIVIASDRIIERRIIHVTGSTADIAFMPPPGVQRLIVHAFLPEATGVPNVQTEVDVDPGPTTLRISVTSDKAQYLPGERARFHVHVTDDRGRPVRAQLGVGVVDAAIYALAPQVLDPHAAFYGSLVYPNVADDWQEVRPARTLLKTIANVSSSSNSYVVQTGSEAGVPAGAPAPTPAPTPQMPQMQLRTNFQDTAYWSPDVVTDARGDATVTLTWPDDLTTWTSTAVGITQRTQIGLERVNTLVTKPFLVRLATPRFLRAGDRAQITGIAQGKNAGTPVRLELDAPAFGVTSQQQTVLDKSLRASAAWTLQAPGVGSALIALRGTDESLTDGMQMTLPLLAGTPVEHMRSAGIAGRDVTIPTPLESGQLAGALHLSFSSSAIAEIAETMQAFDVYPYFCTEQTGSTGMVAAAFLQAAHQLAGIDVGNKPSDVIERARKRLLQLRHSDGAWGWWPQDQTNAFMTAYALWSLKTMDDAQNRSGDRLIPGAAAWLARDLSTDSQLSNQETAFALFALAYAAPDRLPRDVLNDRLKSVDRADVTTAAFLGLAAAAVGQHDDATRAAQRVQQLGITDGDMTYWHTGSWGWEWWTDPIADTSYAAMLFDAVGDRERERSAATFLRAQHGGNWWYTTADTAAATTVLARIESRLGARSATQTVRVLVGDREVRTIDLHALADAADTQVVIPLGAMQSHEPVRVENSGGVLYWSSDFERYVNRNVTTTKDASESLLRRLFAAPPALSVNRRYTVNHAGPWRVGDEVTVDLWITARDGAQYVTLEDPYPAGVEYQPAQGEAAYSSWSGAQYLDDRAAFFIYWLPAGLTERLQYQLRVTTPGEFTAPGPSAYASYGPPVKAVGTGETVVVK